MYTRTRSATCINIMHIYLYLCDPSEGDYMGFSPSPLHCYIIALYIHYSHVKGIVAGTDDGDNRQTRQTDWTGARTNKVYSTLVNK